MFDSYSTYLILYLHFHNCNDLTEKADLCSQQKPFTFSKTQFRFSVLLEKNCFVNNLVAISSRTYIITLLPGQFLSSLKPICQLCFSEYQNTLIFQNEFFQLFKFVSRRVYKLPIATLFTFLTRTFFIVDNESINSSLMVSFGNLGYMKLLWHIFFSKFVITEILAYSSYFSGESDSLFTLPLWGGSLNIKLIQIINEIICNNNFTTLNQMCCVVIIASAKS